MTNPPPWRYRCYVSEDQIDEIKASYDRQSKQWRQRFLDRTRALKGLPLAEWELPLFRWLRRDGTGLGEVRFKADGIQQRILGFRGPDPDLFTLLSPAQEKNDTFIPRNAVEIAQRLKAAVETNKDRSHECWLFPDPKPEFPRRTPRR
jgi:hypothetical protein